MKKLIYLASPYSHSDPRVMAYREEQVNSVAAHLYLKHKVSIIPPIMISAVMKRHLGNTIGTSFKEWRNVDLRYIAACDEVWVVTMSGWNQSIGVIAEIEYAKKNNIPVKYISPVTLKFIKRPKEETV